MTDELDRLARAKEAAQEAEREAEAKRVKLEADKASIEAGEKRLGQLRKIKEQELAILEAKKAQALADLEIAKEAGAGAAALAAYQATIDSLNNDIEAQTTLTEAATKAQQEFEQALAGTVEATRSMLGLGLSAEMAEWTALGKNLAIVFENAADSGMGFGGVLKEVFIKDGVLALKSIDLVRGGVSKFIGATIELAMAQDEARSAFMKSTGAGMEYGRTIAQVQRQMAMSGVEAADAGQAITDLYTGMSQFSQLNEDVQIELGKTTAALAELGVSAGTSAKILDTATRSLGMSGMQAEALLRDIAATAKAIGLPMGKLADDFAAASPQLTKYGDNMMKVFEGLAAQSKQTGIEIGQLLNITGQFDKFDQAGAAVGRLNAIMGGPYLNSIDLLNATEEERIDILQRMTQQAGIHFDELNRFEQMAIADAMGVSVDEARRLLGASSVEFEKQALAQEHLAESAAKAQSVIDQLKAVFNALLIDMQPIIDDFIIPFVAGMRDSTTGIGNFIVELKNMVAMAPKILGIAGTVLIAAAATMLWLSGGALAPFAIPMLMLGGKLAGVGMALGWAGGKAKAAYAEGVAASGKGPSEGVMAASKAHKATTSVPIAAALHGGVIPPDSPVTMVGEQGIEFVELPHGTEITDNMGTAKMAKSMDNLAAKLDKLTAAGAARQHGGDRRHAGNNVVIKVGAREVGTVFIKDILTLPEVKAALLLG